MEDDVEDFDPNNEMLESPCQPELIVLTWVVQRSDLMSGRFIVCSSIRHGMHEDPLVSIPSFSS